MKHRWYRALFMQRVNVILLLLAQFIIIIYTLFVSGGAFRFASIIFNLVSVIASIYIISRRGKNEYKLVWVFLILLVPFFGGMFYLIFNIQLSTRKFKTNVNKISLQSTCSLNEKHCLENCDGFINQARYLNDYAGFSMYDSTETEYLSSGEKFFSRLVNELKKARHYIFLEFFIIENGYMWQTILSILQEKAKHGIRVKIIYDDIGCFMRLPCGFAKEMESKGIECAVFNPFRPFLAVRQNNRDHRKIVSIDGEVAFTGGLNLSDEYINKKHPFGHWKDAGIMLRGEAALSLSAMFLRMWNATNGSNEDILCYKPKSAKKYGKNGYIIPYSDSPTDDENICEQIYLQIINDAKKYVYICTPYLIISEVLINALCLGAKRGVDVRIVTPHIADKRFVQMTSRSYYRELIDSGIKIYEYTNGFIHSKTFVSDDTVGNVGTANLDFRSLYLHFECGVWMCNTTAIKEMKDDFISTLEKSTYITRDMCQSTFVSKTIQNSLRIFAPLM